MTSPSEFPAHITNAKTKGMPHEAGNYTCWCIESVDVLQQEIVDLRAKIDRLTKRGIIDE